MKKTFRTSPINITEIIYNQKQKHITLKKWQKKDNSKSLFECWGIFECYTDELKDFYYCSLKDIKNTCRGQLFMKTCYPYRIKHISKFNLY